MNLVSNLQQRIEHLNRVTDEVWQLQLQNNDNSKVGRALGPRGKTLVVIYLILQSYVKILVLGNKYYARLPQTRIKVTFIQFVAEKDAALCRIGRSDKW